jgi:nucleotide-binding universal stress UspA family protein
MAEAERKLSELVAAAIADDQRVVVRTKVVRGEATKVLLAEAEDATLLVVGSRGRGSFAQLLLGSVSDRCAQHADCPVLVMR